MTARGETMGFDEYHEPAADVPAAARTSAGVKTSLRGSRRASATRAAPTPFRLSRLILLACAVLLLAGCGGDGKSATTAARGEGSAVAGGIPALVRDVRPSIVAVLVTGSTGRGEGSGVVWDKTGLIVTNEHVISNARQIRVGLASGERIPARVQATDPRTDLALLKVDRSDLPPASFARSLPEVGQLAVAIGNPLGFESSATSGIVSGVGRAIPTGGRTPALVGLIQTDAPISPGNSGGALVGQDGTVMGISNAFIPPQARAVSIGFAIPASVVIDVVGQLRSKGRAQHAYLGVALTELTPQIARRFGITVSEGAIITTVDSGTPGARASLQPGDVIVGAGGTQVRSVEDVFAALRRRKPGDRLGVTMVSHGIRRTVNVTLADLPARAG